jgi:hypothetical protein
MESFIDLMLPSEALTGVKFFWHMQIVDTAILELQTGPPFGANHQQGMLR